MSHFRSAPIQILAVLGSGHHIFQRIGTKFRTDLKLSNADVVLSGQVAPMWPHERAHWCHLANMIEPSVCGGDAVLCQITLTTC